MSETRVTSFEIEHTYDGALEARITVLRVPEPYAPPPSPDVNDIPSDMRAALTAWLLRGGHLH